MNGYLHISIILSVYCKDICLQRTVSTDCRDRTCKVSCTALIAPVVFTAISFWADIDTIRLWWRHTSIAQTLIVTITYTSVWSKIEELPNTRCFGWWSLGQGRIKVANGCPAFERIVLIVCQNLGFCIKIALYRKKMSILMKDPRMWG